MFIKIHAKKLTTDKASQANKNLAIGDHLCSKVYTFLPTFFKKSNQTASHELR